MATSIQIAPNMEQIRIDYANNLMVAEWDDIKVQFQASIPLREQWDETYKKCFGMAIALCSKPWQIERAMSDAHVPGRVIITKESE